MAILFVCIAQFQLGALPLILVRMSSSQKVLYSLTNLVDDDLHDLHDLRARFLVFIHSLLESLRASGVSLATPSSHTDVQIVSRFWRPTHWPLRAHHCA